MINVDEIMKAADELRVALPIMCRLMRTYYNELIEAGFSKAEALKIVISHGYVPPGPK